MEHASLALGWIGAVSGDVFSFNIRGPRHLEENITTLMTKEVIDLMKSCVRDKHTLEYLVNQVIFLPNGMTCDEMLP